MADERVTNREGLEQVGMTVVVAAGVVAKTLPYVQQHPELAAFIDVVGPALGFSLGRQTDYFLSQRMPRWTKGVSDAFEGDAKKFDEHAQKQAQNPDHHEAMYRSFRMMMDAADESVIETLGYLAGVYSYSNKKPDAFFRSLGRLLCDLEAGELTELRRILRAVLDTVASLQSFSDKDVHVAVERVSVALDGAYEDRLNVYYQVNYMTGVVTPSGFRLLALLKRDGLAGMQPIPRPWSQENDQRSAAETELNDVPADGNSMRISLEIVAQMVDVIDPRLAKS